jgi:WD40 repeat protein
MSPFRSRRAWVFVGLALVALPGLVPAQGPGQVKVVATFGGHAEPIYALAASPDGKLIATGSWDRSVRLHETATGKAVRTMAGAQGHTKMVLAVAFSPDGRQLATGGEDNVLKIWDVPSSDPLRTYSQNQDWLCLGPSPDSSKVALGGKNGGLKLLSSADFKQIAELAGHNGPVYKAVFGANGQFVASAGQDETVRYWNAGNGQPIGMVGAHHGGVRQLALHPSAAAAFTAGDDSLLKFWNGQPAPARLLGGHGGEFVGLTLSADGNEVVTASADKTIRRFAFANAAHNLSWTGATDVLSSVALAGNGAVLAAGQRDGQWNLWDGRENKLLAQRAAHTSGPVQVAIHPQANQLLSGGAEGTLKTWMLPAQAPVILTHPDKILAAVPSPDGKRLFTGGGDKIVRMWDMSKSAVERQYAGHAGAVTTIASDGPTGSPVSGSADGTIRIWDPKTSKETAILGASESALTALAVFPGAKQILSADAAGRLTFWQPVVHETKPLVHVEQVTCLAASSDGTKLLTGCADKVVRLWDLPTGAKLRELTGANLPIQAVAFSPDAAWIAAISADKTLALWKAGDGQLVHRLPLSANPTALAFSTSGATAAVGLADGTLYFADVTKGQLTKTTLVHKGAVTAIHYVGADELLTASADHTMQHWNVKDPAGKIAYDHGAPIEDVAVSPDKAKTAIIGGGKLHLRDGAWWKAGTKSAPDVLAKMDGKRVAFSADSRAIVVTGRDNRARVHGLDGVLWEWFAHEAPVNVAVFLDARRLVTAGADKTAMPRHLNVLWAKEMAGPIEQLAILPGHDAFVAARGRELHLVKVANGALAGALAVPGTGTVHFALTADASRLVAVAGQLLTVWPTAPLKADPSVKPQPEATYNLQAPATSVSVSPNGQRVALALGEKGPARIRLLELSDGRLVQEFTEPNGPVTSLRFAGDGRSLVALCDKVARSLDVAVDRVWSAHPGGVVAVQYHANGNQALSAGHDRTVKLWDLARGVAIRSFGPLSEPIRSASFSRDFTQIGVAAGQTVRIWDVAAGSEVAVLRQGSPVLSVAFANEKTRLATGGADGLTRVWDLPSGQELQFFKQSGPVAAVAWHPGNQAIVSAAGAQAASIDLVTATRVIKLDAGPAHGLAVSPNGAQVFTASGTQFVQYNTGNGAKERVTPLPAPATALAIAKNNVTIAVACADKSVHLFTLADGKEIGAATVPASAHALAFSPDSARLLASCENGQVQALSAAFQPGAPMPQAFLKPIQSFQHSKAGTDVAFGPDNQTIWSCSLDQSLVTWKLASDVPVKQIGHGGAVTCIVYPPGGGKVLTGCADGKIRLIDIEKAAVVKEINAHPQPGATTIYSLAVRPGHNQVASTGYDGAARLWDLESGKLVHEYRSYRFLHYETPGHQDSIYCLAFSPDGNHLATGSAGLEDLIKIWDVERGFERDLVNPQLKQVPKFERSHPGWIYGLAYTRDGKQLVSVGVAPLSHGYFGLWEPATGRLIHGESMPLGAFFSLALLPGDRTVAVAAGARGKSDKDVNKAYILNWPAPGK